MSKQMEKSNIREPESTASMNDGFAMQWNTDDLPEGMKRRNSHHHRHHRHSSRHSRSHSSHHHSAQSYNNSTGFDSSKPEFEELLYRSDSSGIDTEKQDDVQSSEIHQVITETNRKTVPVKNRRKQESEFENTGKTASGNLLNRNNGKSKHKESTDDLDADALTSKMKGDRTPKSSGRKIGIAVIALVVAMLLGGLGFLNGFLNKIDRENSEDLPKADSNKKYENIDKSDVFGVGDLSLTPIRQDEVKNILLIGQDRRKGDGTRKRSDSMIVATIDLTTNEIKLTSLMRDMYVPVPGYGYGMINATYLHGGMALLDETIERDFGITIDGNVEVDFTRFIALMDLIGPLDIELNQEEAEYLNREGGWKLKAGNNTMNSEQVLAFCRVRYVGRSDWERTDRQRSVVTKMFDKLRQSDLSTLYRFANEVFPLFKTDLSNSEILRYVYTVISRGMHITESKRLPKDGTYTQEIREETLQVLVPDLRANAELLQEYVYGRSDIQVKKNSAAVVKTDNNKNSKKKSSSLVIEE